MKPRKSVIAAALLAILLLAAAVCMLHAANATSLRGTVRVSDYALTDGAAEGLIVQTDDPWKDAGVMYITGALMRPGQQVGAVHVRVALLPEILTEGKAAQMEDAAILLNTQMVRRQDLAAAYGCDDHCGFYAAVRTDLLPKDHAQYRVLLAEETEGAKRMVETGLTVVPIEGGLAFGRAHSPEEAQGNE